MGLTVSLVIQGVFCEQTKTPVSITIGKLSGRNIQPLLGVIQKFSLKEDIAEIPAWSVQLVLIKQ